MGCLWSSDASELNHRYPQARACNIPLHPTAPQLNIAIERGYPHQGRIQAEYLTVSTTTTTTTIRDGFQPNRPLYGEYRCSCGRFWTSRLSWKNAYQMCKRCKTRVYPCNQREVRPSDMTRKTEDLKEHNKEYCQKCRQLGHYCGKSYDFTKKIR